jgi:exodeoxyribonuclease V alpha subunit
MNPSTAMDAAELLASGFAEHIVRWATEKSGTAPDARQLQVLRRAAFHVSLATGGGHACALLAEIFSSDGADGSNDEFDGVRQMLLHSGVVGSPEAPGAMPLILDRAGRLYLHRYFDYEQRLARRLLVTRPPAPIDANVRAQLHTLFAANQAALAGRPDWQQIAAALALRQSITVISGGPGTGKTTTVVNILACLLAQDPACRIALAAPTGKAAARMLEALRARRPSAASDPERAAAAVAHGAPAARRDADRRRVPPSRRQPAGARRAAAG